MSKEMKDVQSLMEEDEVIRNWKKG
jgi:hypothetical protein